MPFGQESIALKDSTPDQGYLSCQSGKVSKSEEAAESAAASSNLIAMHIGTEHTASTCYLQ